MQSTVTLQPIRPWDIDDEITRMPAAIWKTISSQGALYTLKQGTEKHFLVIWDGRRVGIVGYRPEMEPDKGVWLSFCGILPEYRRNGLFRRSMAQLEVLIANEFPSAVLVKENGPEHVVEPFERIGFALIEKGSKDWGNVLHKRIG